MVQTTDLALIRAIRSGDSREGPPTATRTAETNVAAEVGTARAAGTARRTNARPAEGEIMCSFARNGEEFLEQHWYHCYTCGARLSPMLKP